jgi:hypothetical protein
MGYKPYPITDYVHFWHWPCRKGYRCWAWHIVKNIPWSMKKLLAGHKIYHITDFVNFWPPSVTLTLEVGDQLLRMTHCLIIVNNCGKYFQNPCKIKKVIRRTRHIPSNRQCWPWMSRYDLDPGCRGLVVAHGTSSYYNKHLCQVISNTFDKWQSYGPDTKVWQADGQKDGRTDVPTIGVHVLFLWSLCGIFPHTLVKLPHKPGGVCVYVGLCDFLLF